MSRIDILEEDVVLDERTGEAYRARMAADDLRRIEEEVKQEAEASVEAAETAFDFDQAEGRTERIADDAEARRENGNTQS